MQHALHGLRLDKKLVEQSLILLLVTVIPYTYVHEFGHAIGCVLLGYNIEDFGLGFMTCSISGHNLLFFASGGLFAAGVALGLLAVKRINKSKALKVVLLTLAIYNLYNAGIETFTFEAYAFFITNNNVTFAVVNAVMLLSVYFVFMFKLLRKTQ